MTALYEITERYNQALTTLSDSEFDEQTITDTLEAIKGEVEEKSINVAAFLKNLEADASAIDDAIKAMAARKKSLLNRASSMKDYLKFNMERSEITNISCPYFEIKITKNPSSIVIDDESLIPDKYKYEVATFKIDKRAIKQAGNVPGTHIEQGTRLVIK